MCADKICLNLLAEKLAESIKTVGQMEHISKVRISNYLCAASVLVTETQQALNQKKVEQQNETD